MIEARFDDLRPGRERSFRLIEPVGVVEARAEDEVGPPSTGWRTRRGADGGRRGSSPYEAAPGLDPALSVRERERGDPFAALPLLWFALFEGREDVPSFEPVGRRSRDRWHGVAASIDRARYDASVAAIRERIAAGDTYQVNYTIRLRADLDGDECDLYRDLCLAQRGGYAAYLSTGGFRVLSASPELFFRMDGDHIMTRPMKGTAPRGRWAEEDGDARPDWPPPPRTGRRTPWSWTCCEAISAASRSRGRSRARRLFETERYETVWQLTSTVRSTLRPGISLSDAFRALFPSGSVTGAPKVSTMRLISELEDSPRGPYCGAIGYLAPPGSAEPGRTSTWPSAPWSSTGKPGWPSTASAAASRTTPRPPVSSTRRWPRLACSPRAGPGSICSRPSATSRRRGSAISQSTWPA